MRGLHGARLPGGCPREPPTHLSSSGWDRSAHNHMAMSSHKGGWQMRYHAGQPCAQLKIRGNIILQEKGRLGMEAAWWSLPQAPAGSHQPRLACILHVCLLVLLCVRRREKWLLVVLKEPESHLWDPTPSASSLLPLVLSQRFQLGPPPPPPPSACLRSLSSLSPLL